MTLLDRYDQWSEKREAIWNEEAEGWDEYSSDDMYLSDDEGVELLEQFKPAYEGLLKAVSDVLATDGLPENIRDLQQVSMLDTTSSASRQHYIDTGRYLQEGEAR